MFNEAEVRDSATNGTTHLEYMLKKSNWKEKFLTPTNHGKESKYSYLGTQRL
jgi:hypothetical protein